jgi:TonB-linked SusC/RagA family outer membrane protein
MKFYTSRSGSRHGGLYKFLLYLRLVLVIVTFGLLQASAASYGQQLSLHKKNATLRVIFKEIKRQTGYDVLWQKSQLDGERRIQASFNNSSLHQVMDACLQGQHLSYVIDEQSIILRPVSTPEFVPTFIHQDSVVYIGKVTDENNKPMAGASVRIKGGSKIVVTSAGGDFRLYAPAGQSVLQVTYVGYAIKEIALTPASPRRLSVQLLPATGNLSEVQVVSNGYQDIDKERATGSFEVVTAKQLEHSTDPSLLKRLEGITTGMNFNNNNTFRTTVDATLNNLQNRNRNPLADLTIRGKNTLAPDYKMFNNSGFPLLVIDGIASAYQIDQLNPEDIESVTVLKDAASASIWGARAANGVLVVKTKRGSFQQPLNISLNTNFAYTEKPDLFYREKMSTSDFIDAERERFIRAGTNLGVPSAAAAANSQSQVAEIMNDYLRRGVITEAEANAQLDALRSNDVRRDVSKYLTRAPFIQNYSLGIAAGSKGMAYRISAGYNNSQGNAQYSGTDRLNLGYNATVRPLKGLELSWNASYIQQNRNSQAGETIVSSNYLQFRPYDRLADEAGNALPLFKYRPLFIDALKTTYGSRILDMTYKPLEEMGLGSIKGKIQSMNLLLNATYRFNTSLSGSLSYSYNRQLLDEETFYSRDSYYMREQMNRFTDPVTFALGFPYGHRLGLSRNTSTGQTLRGQLNYSHTWNGRHALNAVGGGDASQSYAYRTAHAYLGYNDESLRFNNNVNLLGTYPLLYRVGGASTGQLPLAFDLGDNRIRSLSTFFNTGYTYDNRYTFSGSVRRDGSNIFGVKENRSGTPFYSTGLSWNIANEHFYHFTLVPRLQLRATFGYNGNSNPSVYPRPRANFNPTAGPNGLLTGTASSDEATNVQLRPERTGVLNFGLDFAIKGGRLTGSLEYYVKNTKDLIAGNLVDPSTGFTQLNYNTGDLRGTGTDISLNSLNVKAGKFSWNSTFLLSSNRVKMKKLFVPGGQSASGFLQGTGFFGYAVGYDLDRLFAFRWAGLDPATGNPRVFVNGQPVIISDGTQGFANAVAANLGPTTTLRYMGPSVPVYFGSVRNSFSYGSLTVSLNILYKLNYVFRRPNSDLAYYSNLYAVTPQLIGGEYARRWRQPGDELVTNVPSLTYPGNEDKDYIYSFSDINVLKGDHIRLQEVNVSWGLKVPGWGIKSARVFANATNLGILWRANRLGLDPDINDLPNPRSYSFGLSANF